MTNTGDGRFTRGIERLLPYRVLRLIRMCRTRVRFALGVRPLSERWGDRGTPMHRQYLEEFLQDCSTDIQGRCLEFQEDTYTTRFGGQAIHVVDVLHRDEGNPLATIVADLTRPNEIPSNMYDCIVCTQVLHLVSEVDKMVGELYRILRPGGVLLVAVPHITICYPEHHELWRFTEEGLQLLLAGRFGTDNVKLRSFGNSLTTAGWLRGLVARDFAREELAYHDPRFSMLLCARAVKRNG